MAITHWESPWTENQGWQQFIEELKNPERDPRTWRDAAMIILNELAAGTERRAAPVRFFLKSGTAGWDNPAIEQLYEQGDTVLIARLMLSDLLGAGGKLYEIGDLLDHKQRSYGPRNILKFGHPGLAVRMWDKVARFMNLRHRAENTYYFESLNDSKMDLVGYVVVAAMLECDWFELPLDPQLPLGVPI